MVVPFRRGVMAFPMAWEFSGGSLSKFTRGPVSGLTRCNPAVKLMHLSRSSGRTYWRASVETYM